MSEDYDIEDFDVLVIVTNGLESALLGDVLQPEKETNDDESSTDEEPPPIKQKKYLKTHQEKLCLEEKWFSKGR